MLKKCFDRRPLRLIEERLSNSRPLRLIEERLSNSRPLNNAYSNNGHKRGSSSLKPVPLKCQLSAAIISAKVPFLQVRAEGLLVSA